MSPAEAADGISLGTEYVLEHGRKPSETWASADDGTWEDMGFVRRPEGHIDAEDLPLPRKVESLDDQTQPDDGFVRVAGFRSLARKHMIGELIRSLPGDATIYFPFDFIQDKITFLTNSHERDLLLTWKDPLTAGGTSPSMSKQFNGFEFVLSHTSKLSAHGSSAIIHVMGWRNPRFYQIRFQLPLTILSLITTVILLFGADQVAPKAAVVVTAYVAFSSLLLVSSKFVQTSDGNFTIIDVQILVNMASLALFTALSVLEWATCIYAKPTVCCFRECFGG